MTSVVGILNKHGVAIAADSAVTRQRRKDGSRLQKFTKNGNKMVRLCEAVPVAVMIILHLRNMMIQYIMKL